jgi:uncharacterized repeat protein (TIGR01451 family)
MHISTITTSSSVLGGFFGKSPASVSRTPKRLGALLGLTCLLGVGGLVPQAWGADAEESVRNQSPIVVNLKQFKVTTDAKGVSKLGDASVVLPGDVLEYQATYSNRGSSALAVTATLPVPEAVEYIKDSAKSKPGLAHTVAQKDSIYAQEPLVRKVTAAGGVTQTQTVPYADYRFVRWDLGKVQPNTSVEVSIRAKVSQSPVGEATTGK